VPTRAGGSVGLPSNHSIQGNDLLDSAELGTFVNSKMPLSLSGGGKAEAVAVGIDMEMRCDA